MNEHISSSGDLHWDINLNKSPFSNVFDTNYTPSTEEIQQLKALLAELARLDSEITNLSRKRDCLKRYVDAHRALLSPIRRLPTETLSEIFVRCLPEDRYASRDITDAPLLLTTISREWRRTAIATPALWNSLHIFIPSHLTLKAVEGKTAGSTLWLERSRSLPISISLYLDMVRSMGRGSGSVYRRALVDIIIPKFSSRVKELKFIGPSEEIAYLDSLSSCYFPILNALHIQTIGSYEYNPPAPKFLFSSLVRRMPCLNNLGINGFAVFSVYYIQLEIDWDKLTQLTLQPSTEHIFSPAEIHTILGRTRRLQSLALHTGTDNWDSHNVNTSVDVCHLPNLRNLRLSFLCSGTQSEVRGSLENFFRSLCCPSLKVLHLSCHGYIFETVQDVPFTALTSLQDVETLLLDVPLTKNSLLECLSLLPNLHFLQIIDPLAKDESRGYRFAHTVDDAILTCLGSHESTSTLLCPHLKHLRILFKGSVDTSPSRITNDVLLTFLEGRVQSSKAFRSCDILFPEERSFTEEEMRRLQALQKCGLGVRIQYGQPPPPPLCDDSPVSGLTEILPSGLQAAMGGQDMYMEGVRTGIIIYSCLRYQGRGQILPCFAEIFEKLSRRSSNAYISTSFHLFT